MCLPTCIYEFLYKNTYPNLCCAQDSHTHTHTHTHTLTIMSQTVVVDQQLNDSLVTATASLIPAAIMMVITMAFLYGQKGAVLRNTWYDVAMWSTGMVVFWLISLAVSYMFKGSYALSLSDLTAAVAAATPAASADSLSTTS